jgi:hypothetical protein
MAVVLLGEVRIEQVRRAKANVCCGLRDWRATAASADNADGCASKHLIAVLTEK